MGKSLDMTGFLAERMGFEPMCDCSQTDFECGPFNRLGTSPNLCYIPGPDPPTNSAGGNREEQQDRTSNIIQFELGWNPHGSKGFSRLALRIGNLISNVLCDMESVRKEQKIMQEKLLYLQVKSEPKAAKSGKKP